MPDGILYLIEKSILKYFVSVMRYKLPRFRGKAKTYVSVQSDVINRSKPFVFTIECFLLLVLSKARTRCDDITKDQPTNNLISLSNMQILHFPLCLVKGDG